MSVPIHVFEAPPAAWRTSRSQIPFFVSFEQFFGSEVATTTGSLVQDPVSACSKVDGCENELGHCRINHFVLLVEALDLILVSGKDDVIIVKSSLRDGSRRRHTAGMKWFKKKRNRKSFGCKYVLLAAELTLEDEAFS